MVGIKAKSRRKELDDYVSYPRYALNHNPATGVTKFLKKYGYDTKAKRIEVIKEYCKSKINVHLLGNTDKMTMQMIISSNWGDFVKWFKNSNKH